MISARFARLAVTAVTAVPAVLVSACNSSAPAGVAARVDGSLPTTSACAQAYGDASAKLHRDGVEIEDGMEFGAPNILFLSFESLERKDAAAAIVESLPGHAFSRGRTLRVFRNLPLLALWAEALTPELVATVAAALDGHGLAGVYQDRPLQYFLDESGPLIGADVVRNELQGTGHGIGVAINDSGVDVGQGDFANVALNVKFLPPAPVVRPPDFNGYAWVETEAGDTSSGHGTHVAGITGGTGAMSGGQYTGMAPGATLVGVGAGDDLRIYYAVEAFDFILDDARRLPYNIRVINNSWGGTGGGFRPFSPVSVAVKRAHDLGVISVFASGNSGPDPGTLNPHSASPCAISVAMGTKEGYLDDASSRGTPDDVFEHPDITAPGRTITAAMSRLYGAAYAGSLAPPNSANPSYVTISGTSMASPHIAGILALMLEQNPDLTLDQALHILQATAKIMRRTPVHPRGLWEAGAGYVNAHAAVQMAIDTSQRRQAKDTLDAWTGEVPPNVCVSVPAVATECPVSAQHEHDVTVPAPVPGETQDTLHVEIRWVPTGDIDLQLVGPDGKTLGVAGAPPGGNELSLTVTRPKPGTYKVIVLGYQNGPQAYDGSATLYRRVPR